MSSAFRTSRSPTSPTSPTLLRHARQRSEESANPKSPTLLRDARGRQEQPWKSVRTLNGQVIETFQSYAPSDRVSTSMSPTRQWTATTVYDKIYGNKEERDKATERTLSPSDPTRSQIFSETTTIRTQRTPSPGIGHGVRFVF